MCGVKSTMNKERVEVLLEINADLRRKNKHLASAVEDILRTVGESSDPPSSGTMWGTINEMRGIIKMLAIK
jgi:hypothetical protein